MNLSHDTCPTHQIYEIVQNIERMALASNPRIFHVAWASKKSPITGVGSTAVTLREAVYMARDMNKRWGLFDHWVEPIERKDEC